jgi:N-acetylmuramoyl-L-alanine amidase
MRLEIVRRLQRIFVGVSLVALLGLGLIAGRVFGLDWPWSSGVASQGLDLEAFNRQIVLISGHAGHDSGAVCMDSAGQVLYTEAGINAAVAGQAADLLRRAGADVFIFDEYDLRLEGLVADVMLSIHADSCIDASGFKAAIYQNTRLPIADGRLLECLNHAYAAATTLPLHPNTVTHNMTEYHAFRRIDPVTPAAILELGFLGGDQALLTTQPEVAARGVADSVLCFLRGPATPVPPPGA